MCAYDIIFNDIRYLIPICFFTETTGYCYNPTNIEEYNLVIGKAYKFDEFAEILKQEDIAFDKYQAQKQEEETYIYDDDGEMVIHIGVTPAPTTEPTVTEKPTVAPTEKPTAIPTEKPTPVPTKEPTPTPEIDEKEPTPKPTVKPTPTPEPTPISTTSFTDIDGHWAEDTIIKWENEGIINGYDDNTFRPDNSVTRAEFAKIITLAFDLKKAEKIDWADVDSNQWYYPYIERSGHLIPIYPLPELNEAMTPYFENVNKTPNGFLPDNTAIRMHVAETLTELKMKKYNIEITTPSIQEIKESVNKAFKDADYENLYAMHGTIPKNAERMFTYTYLANETDIMEGDDSGYFRPYDNITRAELITIIDRIFSE